MEKPIRYTEHSRLLRENGFAFERSQGIFYLQPSEAGSSHINFQYSVPGSIIPKTHFSFPAKSRYQGL
jgi:hypothetical protein